MGARRPNPTDRGVAPTVVCPLAFCLLLLWPTPGAYAAITVGPWAPLFAGVDLARGTADADEGRPQQVTAVRIDLTTPGLTFTSTPPVVGRGTLDTVSSTTTQFLHDTQAQLAINTSFYTPCCSTTPQQKNIVGLAVTDGTLVSPAQPEARAALLLSQDNIARFVNTAADPFSLDNIDTAFAGSNFVLGLGRDLPATPDAISPARTLVGLGDRDAPGDQRLLYLLTIDAGLPQSAGATRRESAQWLVRFGAHTGVNLDGGGSTLLAARDPDTGGVTRLNHQQGPGRSNANHLGVSAPPAPGPAPALFETLWFAGLPDNSVADFSPEDAVENPAPGLPDALDDDYYFAGVYPAPVGRVPADEPLAQLERAVIAFDPPNDRTLRFHFNLTADQAAAGNAFRYSTAAFQQDGEGTKSAQLELRLNGVLLEAFALSQGQAFTSAAFSAGPAAAAPGANVLSLTQVGGNAAFTNLDFHRLDLRRVVPEPATATLLLAAGTLMFRRRAA